MWFQGILYMQENIKNKLLSPLNDEQKIAVLCEENCILTACPGSGKTKTLTHKLAYLSNKYTNSKLLNIGITYTNRAAYEIEDRIDKMNISLDNVWIGTIHQFCMEFIIRPYYIYLPRLSKGYSIIDDLTKEKYINLIKDKLNITKKYGFSTEEESSINKEYFELKKLNKEIDFEDILNLSCVLLTKNNFIARNIANIIRSINIDEYQDTQHVQYLILAKLFHNNRNILISFVGDVNQSIYDTLGGSAKSDMEINALFGVKFKKLLLNGCYRSTSRIINYYSKFEVEKQNTYSLSDYKDDYGTIYFNKNINSKSVSEEIGNIVDINLKNGVPENEICILCPQWWMAYDIIKYMKERFPDNKFDAIEISPLKYDPMNFVYLIAKILFLRESKNIKMKRRDSLKIFNILKNEFYVSISSNYCSDDLLYTINKTQIIESDGILTLKNAVKSVLIDLEINHNDKIKTYIVEYFDKIKYKIKKFQLKSDYNSFAKTFKEKEGIVIGTIHSVKGEEFTTVIAFGLLDGYLPHNNYLYEEKYKPLKDSNTNHLLYVLCSRARKNLYLFSEKGRCSNKGYEFNCNYILNSYKFDYDESI